MRALQEKLQAQQRARNLAKRDRVRPLLEIIAEDDDDEDVQMVEPAGKRRKKSGLRTLKTVGMMGKS